MRFFNLSAAPPDATPAQRRNFTMVQVDAIGVGLASAAGPFLPVFLARLGATNSQVGLLSSMPALAGLLLALQIGSFLQRQPSVVPWFSRARLLVISTYAVTGLVTFLLPRQYAVVAVLAIWAVVTVPQTIVNISFSVVMNAVAGPRLRYDLMSRRWTLLGMTTAIATAIVGQILVRSDFPVNYQLVFMGLSLGGLISFYFSSHIDIPRVQLKARPSLPFRQRTAEYIQLIRSNKPFTSFISRRLVFMFGQSFAMPLFPLFYVRVLQAPDSAIGLMTTASTACAMIGYGLWVRQSRARGSQFVLLATTFGLALYPAVASVNYSVEAMIVLSGVAGVFSAGLNLVFFDELMKTVPDEHSATFVSLAQMLGYLSAVAAPLLGTALSSIAGIRVALFCAAVLTMMGFVLFLLNSDANSDARRTAASPGLGST